MDTFKIKYCDSNGYLIKNTRFRYDIVNNLKQKLGYDPLNIFEKSYSDRLLEVLKKKLIMATYISFGKYVYVYFTKIYNEPVCLVIELTNKDDKFPKIVVIPSKMNEDVFENTLLYGEIYKSKNNLWYFMVETIVLYKNRIVKENILGKIKLINEIFNDNGSDSFTPFHFHVKKYFNLSQIGESIEELYKNFIKLKGVKFYGLKNPICFYFNTNHYQVNNLNIKHFPIGKNDLSSDIEKLNKEYDEEDNLTYTASIKEEKLEHKYLLELHKTDNYGIYHLFCDNKNILSYIGKAHIPNIELSNEILDHKKSNIIVETCYNYIFKKFTVLSLVFKSTKLSNYDSIIKDIEKTKNLPLPRYVI